ncbi:hypothetical protein LMJF_05_0840 [Leishmania major strain Friedlin]|uniref:Uncharacterized protein n=1 Tax=Leishmania major TaxID=5664 RepID=Q4QJB8_LEIMA|nr:hypothetical protein LMJF_05_0840 [Leishmania major strain Friedlin]CAG9568264.1 hypothetical_protein_-_conserved [Leishmania major strain Friedlin]CAJ02004.1 hypothetical protein LMJF_05_0840 [Leishmania major strain Friedlin]|eukprot:XP_001687561.1 hypothetical protein LMJF_05_0840 [Leishmania major strain Friedlin]
MGNDLSAMSGGGRNLEVWSEARARRVANELPTPRTIPLGHGDHLVPPALLLDAEMRSAADDASSTSSLRSAGTVSTYSTQHSEISKANQIPDPQPRRRSMSMSDMNAATALLAAAAPPQQQQRQLQRRTQYSMYARQMRRPGCDRGRYGLQHHNSGVDFMVANDFFNRSDSTLGSEADLDSSSGIGSSGSNDEEDDAGGVHHRSGMVPREPTLPYGSGRRLTGNELSAHPPRRERNEVDGAPALVSTATAAAAASTTSPPHAKSSSTGRAETITTKTVSVVVSGVDCSSDPPLALTSSRNSSNGSHDSKSSAASLRKGGATPLPSARQGSWHKRLLRPASRGSIRDDSISGSATQRGSPDAADGVLSSHEEKKCKTSKRRIHPEGLLELKRLHRTRSSVAAPRTSSATAGAATTAIGVEALVSWMKLSTTKESPRTEAKWRHTSGDLSGCTAPPLSNEKRGGQCGSFTRVSSPPAQQHHTTGKDSRGRPGANSSGGPPHSSESPTHHHSRQVQHRHCGGDDGNNAVPETVLPRLVDTKHHHRQPRRNRSLGGTLDLHDEGPNDFFASTQRSGQYRMLYGMDSDNRSSTASMREAVCMATGGGGAAAHSFGSLFAGSRAASLYSVSSSPGQAWTGDYADGGVMQLPAAVDHRALDMQKADDGGGTREASRHHSSRVLPCSGSGVACVNNTGAFDATSQPQQADLQRSMKTHLQRMTYTSKSPSLVTSNQVVSARPENSQGIQHSLISALPMPPSVVAAEAPANRGHVGAPAGMREALSAGAPCRDGHGHVHTAASVSRCSSGDRSISPDVSVRELVKSPAKAVSPPLLPQPPPPQTAVMRAKTHSFRGHGGGGRPTNLSATEGVAASAVSLKRHSSCAGRRHHHSNGDDTLHATASVLTSVKGSGSGSASRPTRADSKDLILRPDRTASARRHRRGGGDENVPEGSDSRQRRPQNRKLSARMHFTSFSFSSDSFLYGKVRGRLAKAAAVAANSNSIERRRHTSGCGSSGGTQAHARHHAHTEVDSVALGASPSASSRKGEAECRHRGSGCDNESEMGSVMADLDDLLLGADGRAPFGNLTALYLRSVSSSLSLAPSSRNSSTNGSCVSSGSVRALRKRAARARDLSASSSVDSEAIGRLHPHWTAPPLPQQQQYGEAGATATASSMYRLPLVKTSNSCGGAVASNGSASSAVTGGTRGMNLQSIKPNMAVDVSSSPDASSDRPANINYVLQPLRSPAANGSTTMAAASPEVHGVAKSHSTSSGSGVAADTSGAMPTVHGHEKPSQRPSMAPNVPCALFSGNGGGAHLPRMPPTSSPRHASSKRNDGTDSLTVSFPDANGRGDGGSGAAASSSAASLLAGQSRDSSAKRRRPTTQRFTPWSVGTSLFKALQEAQEPPS